MRLFVAFLCACLGSLALSVAQVHATDTPYQAGVREGAHVLLGFLEGLSDPSASFWNQDGVAADSSDRSERIREFGRVIALKRVLNGLQPRISEWRRANREQLGDQLSIAFGSLETGLGFFADDTRRLSVSEISEQLRTIVTNSRARIQTSERLWEPAVWDRLRGRTEAVVQQHDQAVFELGALVADAVLALRIPYETLRDARGGLRAGALQEVTGDAAVAALFRSSSLGRDGRASRIEVDPFLSGVAGFIDFLSSRLMAAKFELGRRISWDPTRGLLFSYFQPRFLAIAANIPVIHRLQYLGMPDALCRRVLTASTLTP